MRSKLYRIVVPIFVTALIIADNGTQIVASKLLPDLELEIRGSSGHGSAATIIVGVSETGKSESDEANDAPGSEKMRKKDSATVEVPDGVQTLKARIIELQNKGKLGFRKIVPCSSVEGFGVYSPFEAAHPPTKIIFYCEPSNVSTLVSGDRYIIDLAVDFFLIDSHGKPLFGKENAIRMNRVSRSPLIDLYFKIEINVQKARDSVLLMKTVLHDKIKDRSVSSTHKINLENLIKKRPEKV